MVEDVVKPDNTACWRVKVWLGGRRSGGVLDVCVSNLHDFKFVSSWFGNDAIITVFLRPLVSAYRTNGARSIPEEVLLLPNRECFYFFVYDMQYSSLMRKAYGFSSKSACARLLHE